LLDLWIEEATVLCNIGPLPDGSDSRDLIYETLKQGMQHPDKVYKITVYGATFTLLDLLLEMRASDAPLIFKTLVESALLLFADNNRVAEEFLFTNFIKLFQAFPELPVALLIDPALKIFSDRLKKSKQRSGLLTTAELDFIIGCSTLKLANQTEYAILELLSTIYIGKPLLAQIVLEPLLALISHN